MHITSYSFKTSSTLMTLITTYMWMTFKSVPLAEISLGPSNTSPWIFHKDVELTYSNFNFSSFLEICISCISKWHHFQLFKPVTWEFPWPLPLPCPPFPNNQYVLLLSLFFNPFASLYICSCFQSPDLPNQTIWSLSLPCW